MEQFALKYLQSSRCLVGNGMLQVSQKNAFRHVFEKLS